MIRKFPQPQAVMCTVWQRLIHPADRIPWSEPVHLRFVDRRYPAQAAADDLIGEVYSSTRSLPDGMPLLLDDRWRPLEPWLSYFRVVGAATGKSTLRNYGYDALRFASFLDDRDTDVVNATNEDIVAYRESRLTKAERPVSASNWRSAVVATSGVYRILMQNGESEREPKMSTGRV